MTLARDLVRRVRLVAQTPLPPSVEHCARLHLLDAIGVGLAAMASDVGRPYRAYAAGVAQGGPASILGFPGTATASEAALINGGLIHSLEYDDTHTASIVHGSAVLAPAALAAAQVVACSGARMLRVYALGWEVLIRMGIGSPGQFQARGFQITSVGGALVAALMAAELWDLSEDRAVAAVGISLSAASGVFEFLTNGSSVKSMHPGWAAHGGLVAANLARAGLTGPETAIEGRFGLFQAFAGDEQGAARFAASLDDLGVRWRIEEAAFKFYPCCHYLHPFIEAAGLIAEHVDVHQIAHLLGRVPAGAAPIVCEPWAAKQDPTSGHAARWSLPAVVASRFVDGRVDLATFEKPPSPAVHQLAARMSWVPLADANFPTVFEAELLCTTHAGTEHHIRIEDVYGNVGRPPATGDVKAKFRANAALALPPEAVDSLETAIDRLSSSDDLATLAAALARSSPCPERSRP